MGESARARFDALHEAARDHGDAAAGLELASLLVRMRFDRQHPDIDRAWEGVLAVPWDRPDRVAPAALAYLAMHASVQRALADPADAAALAPAIQQLSVARLFQLVAASALVTSPGWQGLMLRWRALAMQRWLETGATVPGLAWVAVQGNLAEYVWPVDVAQADMQRLRERAASEDADPQDAVLLACFEHPGPEGKYALDESDPGQKLLFERLYREPDEERVIAAGLVSGAAEALPQRAQRAQYEKYPYPRWIAEPLLPSAVPAAVHARLKPRWWRRRQVLLAGCGTGLQCLAAAATHPDAAITAIDFSVASMAYAVRKCRNAGLKRISFEPADLLAYARRGARFDLVECIGVLHHLSDLEAGAAALRLLTRPGALLRLAVYSAAARQPVRDLRAMIASRGLDGSLQALRQVRTEVLAGQHGTMSASMLESPDLHSASGLHDLLFNACEHTMGATEWAALLGRHGFELLCMDPPAATLVAAGPGAEAWSPREWEDFERTHPFAFASMYEFWLVAS